MRLFKIIFIIFKVSFLWSKLNLDQRKNMFSIFLKEYAEHIQCLVVPLPDGNLYGRCEKSNAKVNLFTWFTNKSSKPSYTIYLNLHRKNCLEVLETVLHEFRHVEQEIENPSVFAGYKNSVVHGFKAYFEQDCEVDARRYAKEKSSSWDVLELLWASFKKVVK